MTHPGLSHAFNAGPAWLGIGLIVVGALLARAFGRRPIPAGSQSRAS